MVRVNWSQGKHFPCPFAIRTREDRRMDESELVGLRARERESERASERASQQQSFSTRGPIQILLCFPFSTAISEWVE
jgi:hypothetical protein